MKIRRDLEWNLFCNQKIIGRVTNVLVKGGGFNYSLVTFQSTPRTPIGVIGNLLRYRRVLHIKQNINRAN